MGGLIFFAVLGVWFFIVLGVVAWVAKKLPERWWRVPLSVFLFVVILILPIIDEIVGGWQFKRLCEANADISFDEKTAVGRTVYLAEKPDIEIKDTWVRIKLQPWNFVDVETGDVVVNFNTLRASGGWVFKNVTQGGGAILFWDSCSSAFKAKSTLFKKLKIVQVERSSIKLKD